MCIEKKDKYWNNEEEKRKFYEDLKEMRKEDLQDILEGDYSFFDSSVTLISRNLFKKNGKLMKEIHILKQKLEDNETEKIENAREEPVKEVSDKELEKEDEY